MRLFIAALLLLGIGLYNILTASGSHLLFEIEKLKNLSASNALVIVILSAYVFLEALYLLFQGERTSTDSEKETAVPKERKEQNRLAELTADYESVVEEKEALRLALSEAQAQLESQKMQTRLRPELVDAEIINLLSLLQEKGRFVDFLMDDITPYDDSQIGRAARIVHQGCSAVLREYFHIAPIHDGSEGERISLGKEFDPKQYRLAGRVTGEPPFEGVVVHKGWRTSEVTLPRVVEAGEKDAPREIIAPVEVELH